MKIKPGFVLRDIAGEHVAVPVGDGIDLNMMITLNDTGSILWKKLETGADLDELVQALLSEYDIDEETAKAHAEKFVGKLKDNGFLE